MLNFVVLAIRKEDFSSQKSTASIITPQYGPWILSENHGGTITDTKVEEVDICNHISI